VLWSDLRWCSGLTCAGAAADLHLLLALPGQEEEEEEAEEEAEEEEAEEEEVSDSCCWC
jgi:hypothetical protein